MKFVVLWAPVAAVMGALYLASSRSDLIADGRVSDKLMHVLAYMLLGAFLLRATHGGTRELRLVPTLVALLLTLAYGASDEWHQFHVPGRVASVGDFLADALGAGLSILLMGLLGTLRAKSVRTSP